jgi:hypothetical protein
MPSKCEALSSNPNTTTTKKRKKSPLQSKNLFFVVVVVGRGLELSFHLCACKASALQIEPPSSPFCSGYFGDEVSRTICSSWSQTSTLLITASQVARIADMSHQHPAPFLF